MNVARYFVPHVLCLSTSVAVLDGPQHRAEVVPQHHLPPLPALRHPAASSTRGPSYERPGRHAGADATASPTARRSGGTCGRTGSYPTLEFRICDVCTRVDEAVCIAAIFQAIIAKLWKLRRDNMTFRVYPTDADRGEQVAGGALRPRRQAARPRQAGGTAGPRADPRADRVVPRRRARRTGHAARRSSTPSRSWRTASSADRQLAVFERTGDLKAVVDR